MHTTIRHMTYSDESSFTSGTQAMKREAKTGDNLIDPTQGAQVGCLGYSYSSGELGEPGVIRT
jgi:hypothetical protein